MTEKMTKSELGFEIATANKSKLKIYKQGYEQGKADILKELGKLIIEDNNDYHWDKEYGEIKEWYKKEIEKQESSK